MALEHLWAEWRGEYIQRATETERADAGRGVRPEAGERCVFCRILADGGSDDEANIIWRGTSVFAILNAYPYTSGHLMVMPYRHVGALTDLDTAARPTGTVEASELWAAVTDATRAIEAAYAPEGINVGINLGRAAGAGVPGHLHVHLVPRWNGDTNFMTATAATRVMPESLHTSGSRLRAAWPTPGQQHE